MDGPEQMQGKSPPSFPSFVFRSLSRRLLFRSHYLHYSRW